MKSITTCPHCDTQFYVDDAQLAQFKGKVRCGNCLEVFAAADYFVNAQSEVADEPAEAGITEPNIVDEPSVIEEVEAPTTQADVLVNATESSDVPESTEVDDLPDTNVLSFKRSPTSINSLPETPVNDEPSHEELDGLTKASDVDENFIAKTESLIKNIDIEDVESKLEPALSSITQEDNNKPEEPVRRSFLDEEPDEVKIQQPGFSFKIDSPDTLDVLSKWREDSANQAATEEIPVSEHQETNAPSVDKQMSAASIAEPPTPMQDDFVLPDPALTAENADKADEGESAANDNYDFLLTEKEPLSPWMIALAVILVLLLLGQAIYYFRDSIAREMPETKPLLQQFCAPIGCKISLPQEINLLSIDDSGIQQDAKLSGVIKLTSTITNRAKFNQDYPQLEVTLTDERDQPKVRRIFKPSQYLPKNINLPDGIQAGESVPVEMALMTDAVNVSGFRILLTY